MSPRTPPPPPALSSRNGLIPWPRDRAAAVAVAGLAVAAGAARLLPPLLPRPLLLALLALLALPPLAALVHVALNPVERWRFRRVPGFPYKAPFGDLPGIVRAGGLPHFCVRGAELYGPTFKMWRGQACVVVTADPDAAKKLGARLSARGAALGGGVGDPLGLGVSNPRATGLLLADGERFTMLKRAWQPAFAPSSLRAYAPLLRRAAEGAVARLRADVARAASGGGEGGKGAGAAVVDVHAVMAGMTMAAVGSCAFGVDWGTLAAPQELEEEEKEARPASSGSGSGSSGSSSSGAGSDADALNNGDGETRNERDQGAAKADAAGVDDAEFRSMGRMLVEAAEDIFGGTRLASASRWSLLAMAWPWATPLLRPLARRFPDAPLVLRVEARRRLDAASRFLIERARAQMAAQEEEQEEEDRAAKKAKAAGVTGIEPGSFLACLMREGAGLTTDDVATQAQTFMLAGYETTLSALSFAVMLLARHPDKAAALRRAIDDADAARRLQKKNGGADAPADASADADSAADADACIPYANAVLDEAMRLYPPGTAIGRSPAAAARIHASRGADAAPACATAPLLLPGRPGRPAIIVPPETRTVQGVLYAVHRNRDVWPRADEFFPERFLPDGHPLADPALKAASPNAFLPFGAGARMCIGYRFALLEARTALVALCRHFEFEAAAGPGDDVMGATAGDGPLPIRTATGITMGPDGGVWCVVRERAGVVAAA
jgi:thromboxane-A synthase/cytochrome P450 family 3 subfamily A